MRAVVLAGVLAACAGDPAQQGYHPPCLDCTTDTLYDPGVVVVEPERLAFACTTIGCDETRSITVRNDGGRPVTVFAARFEPGTSPDFSARITVDDADAEPPIDLAAGASLSVAVRYVPADAEPDRAVLRVRHTTSADGDDATLVLVETQALGFPRAALAADALVFPYVAAGTSFAGDLRVQNQGTGNAILEITGAHVVEEGTPFAVTAPVGRAALVNPGDEQTIALTFAPPAEGAFTATVRVETNDPLAPVLEATVAGTSWADPVLALFTDDGSEGLDFGAVHVGDSVTRTLTVQNAGSGTLQVSSLLVLGDLQDELVPSVTVVPPLELLASFSFDVRYTPVDVGDTHAQLRLTTNAPGAPQVQVALIATGVDPALAVSPAEVALGDVVQGWALGPVPVVVRNAGVGPLTILELGLDAGTNPGFTVEEWPALPLVLATGASATLALHFAAATVGDALGGLRVVSDDRELTVASVPFSARVVRCQDLCTVANGIPDCTSGTCAVGGCAGGWLDLDGAPANGCECATEAGDPGAFCTQAHGLGTLTDTGGDSASADAMIQGADDVDLFTFFADDSGSLEDLFGDSYDVHITLSGPPGVSMCVYYADNHADHEDGCFFEHETCPGDGNFHAGGSYGNEDGSDYVIKVFLAPGAAPVCQSYRLTVQNG